MRTKEEIIEKLRARGACSAGLRAVEAWPEEGLLELLNAKSYNEVVDKSSTLGLAHFIPWAWGRFLSTDMLRNALLRNADFENSVLHDVDFSDMDLRGANFGEADLRGANFKRARLDGAVFCYASLIGAAFDGADLGGADLEDAEMHKTSFRGASMIDADLSFIDSLQGCDFTDADLSGADVDGTPFDGAIFQGTIFQGVKLSDDQLGVLYEMNWLDANGEPLRSSADRTAEVHESLLKGSTLLEDNRDNINETVPDDAVTFDDIRPRGGRLSTKPLRLDARAVQDLIEGYVNFVEEETRVTKLNRWLRNVPSHFRSAARWLNPLGPRKS